MLEAWGTDASEREIIRDKLKLLVENHEAALLDAQLRDAAGEGVAAERIRPWDAQTDVISLQVGVAGTESLQSAGADAEGANLPASLAEILGPTALFSGPRVEGGEGALFGRVVLCLSSMAADMQSLVRDGWQCYVPALAVFGEVDENRPRDATAPALSAEDAVRGVAQMATRFLQELWSWQHRACELAVCVLRQLAALYAPEHCDPANKSPYFPCTEARHTVVWQGLADLLGVIAATEEVLQQNTSFKQGFLRLHKLTSQVAAAASTAADGTTHITAKHTSSSSSSSSVHDGIGAIASQLPDSCDVDSLRATQHVVARIGNDLMRYDYALQSIANRAAFGSEGPPYLLRRDSQRRTQGGGRHSPAVQAQPAAHPAGYCTRHSPAFRRELLESIAVMLADTEDAIGTPRESGYHQRTLGLCALHYVAVTVLKLSAPTAKSPAGTAGGNATKKEMDFALALGQRIFSLHTRVPAVYVGGVYSVRLAPWMARRMPSEVGVYLWGEKWSAAPTASRSGEDKATVAASQAAARAVASVSGQQIAAFLPTMDRLTVLVSAWLVDVHSLALPSSSEPATRPASQRFIANFTMLLQRGLQLAGDLKHTLQSLLSLLDRRGAPLAPAVIDGVGRGAQLLVMVREAVHEKSGVLASTFDLLVQSVAFVIQQHLYSTLAVLDGVCRELTSSASSSSRSNTELQRAHWQRQAAEVALLLLQQQPLTADSLLVLSILLDVVGSRREAGGVQPLSSKMRSPASTAASVTTAEGHDAVVVALEQLSQLLTYQVRLQSSTKCDFLYWQRARLYPLLIRAMYARPASATGLPYLLAALEDGTHVVLSARHVRRPVEQLLPAYEAFVRRCIAEELLRPLCADIEDDLRLSTHEATLGQPRRTLSLAGAGATAGGAGPKDSATFTRLSPVMLFGEWLHVRAVVQDYLDAQFYNLNALMPNDWKAYEKMRNLGQEAYGLSLVVGEGCLPGGTVDQGLDVLVVTEDIQLFIAHYTYNLNEQIFIQRPSTTTAKHLHTLHTRHIANSIRTHGTGILHTAVNYVYKSILKKLSILSRFMLDDHITSRLQKNARAIASQRRDQARSFTYPPDMAQQFAGDMQKLGPAQDGQSFLAKLARLVSEIGNAIGFLRMMRSGGLRAVADAAQFLPRPVHPSSPATATTVAPAHAENLTAGRHATSRGGRQKGAADVNALSSPWELSRELSRLLRPLDDCALPVKRRSQRRALSDSSTSSTASAATGSGSSEDESDASSHHGGHWRRRAAVTADAVRNVGRVTASIADKLTSGSAYLRILLEAVQERLGLGAFAAHSSAASRPRHRKAADDADSTASAPPSDAVPDGARNESLRMFYLIVPPMCVEFVKHMISEKEQLAKKASDALFTDDGFALGCVFLLELFGVQEHFGSLCFFAGVRAEYLRQLGKVHEAMMAGQQESSEEGGSRRAGRAVDRANADLLNVNSMYLTASMLDVTLREYGCLEEAFVASSVFFPADRCVSHSRSALGPRAADTDADTDEHSTIASTASSSRSSLATEEDKERE